MEIEIQVPELGESLTEATVGNWLKSPGEAVAEGEIIVELETDKVLVEVPAQKAGVLSAVLKDSGETVVVGEVLAKIDTEGAPASAPKDPAPKEAAPAPKEAPSASAAAAPAASIPAIAPSNPNTTLSPAVQRMLIENNLDPAAIPGTGKRGQITKEDVVNFMEKGGAKGAPAPAAAPAAKAPAAPPVSRATGERENRVPMSRLRARIAERLVEAQHTAALLTTFNEVDMSATMAMRTKYKEAFKEKYGIALGFMSVFTKAVIEALKAYPGVNGEVQGKDIIYKNYYDIGVAVGTPRGLVVPVVRDADQLSFIEIEMAIAELAKKARENKLGVEDLSGGTFTISNGGIYGSMLSTPIINPPQSGILGMHNITKRPMVVNDEIVIRPMMYLALSYDHRIVDGREAVMFLVKVKEGIEDPARLLLEI